MGADGQINSADHHVNALPSNNNIADHNDKNTLVFTYGTLKRGFSNHVLLQDMISSGDAALLGTCRTADKLPLVCGPYRVPFLLNFQGLGDHVSGELYSVSHRALGRMDELEGTSQGHYERLPINLILPTEGAGDADRSTPAQAYYAHRSYAEALWKRNGEMGYSCYSKKEAKGYVRRKDRPPNLSFLDQIRIFVSSVPALPPPQGSD